MDCKSANDYQKGHRFKSENAFDEHPISTSQIFWSIQRLTSVYAIYTSDKQMMTASKVTTTSTIMFADIIYKYIGVAV